MMDYNPEAGKLPAGVDLSHGVIQSSFAGKTNTVAEAVARRLAPHGAGGSPCYYNELLLPASVPDVLLDLPALVARFENQQVPNQHDLMTITTVRFPVTTPAHVAWELARGWARASLVGRELAVLLVQHMPNLAARAAKGHCHALAFSRRIRGSHFCEFSELNKPGAKAMLAAEWAAWLAQEQPQFAQ